ncbi:hypothetical protein EDD17DRAFT_1140074 [Pisolithus thermaeus]|nr:hypothetical protein EDD17DRAFT_1140074 [Pisolithus thermaeus]
MCNEHITKACCIAWILHAKPALRGSQSRSLPNLCGGNTGVEGGSVSSFLTHRSDSLSRDNNLTTLWLGVMTFHPFSFIQPWHGTTSSILQLATFESVCKISNDSPVTTRTIVFPSSTVTLDILSLPRLLMRPAFQPGGRKQPQRFDKTRWNGSR